MWQAVELAELRAFLTLAEELHFGRTAERLHLSSSRVSQLLRSLEGKLDSALVLRTSRRVELTAEGLRLRDEAGAAYGYLMTVLERTRESRDSLEGTLALQVFSGPSSGPRLAAVIAAFETRYPGCKVAVGQLPQDDTFGPLRRGEVAAIICWLPIDEPDLVVGPTLVHEPRVLAVARDHPLAARRSVSMEDLAGYSVPRFDQLPRRIHEAWVPSRTPRGRAIPHVPVNLPDRSLAELSVRVAKGEVVHPTVPSAAAYLGPDIVYVPIHDLPPMRSALVWRRPARDRKLRAFIACARSVQSAAATPAPPGDLTPNSGSRRSVS